MRITKGRSGGQAGPEWVSASAIREYAFCGRSYWLSRVMGVRPGRQGSARLRDGVRKHNRHGRTYDWQLRIRRLGRRLLLASVIAAVLAVLGLVLLGLAADGEFIMRVGALTIVAVFGLGVFLVWSASLIGQRTGLPGGAEIVASDTGQQRVARLKDPRNGLVGQPDYILSERVGILRRRRLVPVELKPSRRGQELREADEMQLVVYLMVMRATYGRKAAKYGRVRYRDATFTVRLTSPRIRRCLALAEAVRRAHTARDVPRTHESRDRCASCSLRDVCGQSLAQRRSA